MNVMHVFSADGQLLPDAGIKIWATMLVPAGPEEERWHLHVAAQMAEAALSSGAEGVLLDRSAFVRLFNAGREFVEGDERRRRRDGEQVGEIMLVARTLDHAQPAAASLGKAMRLHAESMKQFKSERLLRAESKLRQAWSEFENVAHLWAAWRLLCRSQSYGEGADTPWPLLLALAERFRAWAEGHHSPTTRYGTRRRTEPLIAAGRAWGVPTQATLPHAEAAELVRLIPGDRFEEMLRSTPA